MPGRAGGAGVVGARRDPHAVGAAEGVGIPTRPHHTSLAPPGCRATTTWICLDLVIGMIHLIRVITVIRVPCYKTPSYRPGKR